MFKKFLHLDWSRVVAILLLILIVPACSTSQHVAELGYWPTDEWRTADPGERGMDSSKLDAVIESLTEQPILSMVVVKDGYIVGEYYEDDDPHIAYDIYSVTKSVTSALIGIAIEQGLINSVDDPVLNYFPEIAIENDLEEKKSILIRHLLAMNSGLDWPEWTPRWNYFVLPMLESEDWNEWAYGMV